MASPCKGIDFWPAKVQHLGSISGRESVPGIVVLWDTPYDVPEFMDQSGNLRRRSVTRIRCDRKRVNTSGLHESAPRILLKHL